MQVASLRINFEPPNWEARPFLLDCGALARSGLAFAHADPDPSRPSVTLPKYAREVIQVILFVQFGFGEGAEYKYFVVKLSCGHKHYETFYDHKNAGKEQATSCQDGGS
jgi:hypothetical protein